MAASNTSTILQEAYILATGNAASAALLAEFEALVDQDGGGYSLVAAQVEAYMSYVEATQGLAATAKALALNGLGIVLTDAEATEIMGSLRAQGIDTWAKIFEFCISLQGSIGGVLDNRAGAAQSFNATLESLGKADLFSGATVQAAVKNMLQNIGSSDTSLSNGIEGLQALAEDLGSSGLHSSAIDGYVAHATVFVDTNGDGVLNGDEYSTTTDGYGNFVLPADGEPGQIVITGGIDIMTGQAFNGTMIAPAGSTVVSPMTTIVQALLASGLAGTMEDACATLQAALGLPPGVNLLSYDPMAVLADGSASQAAQDEALALEKVSVQLYNLLNQLTATIDAANGPGAPTSFGAVVGAIAGAIAAGTLDLTSTSALTAIIQAAATESGAAGVAASAGQVAAVIAAGNAAADAAADITVLSQVAVVTQGEATAALEAGAISGNFAMAVFGFTGSNLADLIAGAIPGLIAPGVAVPPPGGTGGPYFRVYEDLAGVVTFQSNAAGDITLSWSGTPGASVATFFRGGLTGAHTADFGGTATKITLATGQVLAGSMTQLLGLTIDGLGGVSLTDTTLAAADLLTLDGTVACVLNAAAATTLTGTAVDVTAAYAANTAGTVSGLGNEAVTLSDTTLAAADLNTLDALTTGIVNAAAMTTLTGSSAEILAVISGGISTSGAYDATVSGSTSVADANTIDGDTSGVVTATITEGDLATLVTLTGTGNAYTITVTDTTAAAADLTTVDAATTVAVDAAAVTTLTGTAAEVIAAYAANTAGTITGLGNEAVTVSGSTSVADANTIDGATSGIVTATITEGDLATLVTLTGTGNAYTITVTDTTAAAADLTTVDAVTTVAVDAAAVTTLTGTAAEVIAAYAANTAGTITGLGNEAVTVSGSTSVANANSIAAATSGIVTATITEGDLATLVTLTETTNAYTITVTDTTAAAADLTTVDGKTTVAVTASAVTTLTGTAAEVIAAYAANTAGTITGLGDEAVTVSGTASVANANSIAAATSGIVTATITEGDLATLLTLTETTNAYTITVTDTTAAAADLTTVDGKTTVAVNAAAVTTLTGTAAQVIAAYAANTAGTITGLGNEAVTVSGSTSVARREHDRWRHQRRRDGHDHRRRAGHAGHPDRHGQCVHHHGDRHHGGGSRPDHGGWQDHGGGDRIGGDHPHGHGGGSDCGLRGQHRRHHHRPGQRGGDRLGQHLGRQREQHCRCHQRHRDGHHHRRRPGHAGHPHGDHQRLHHHRHRHHGSGSGPDHGGRQDHGGGQCGCGDHPHGHGGGSDCRLCGQHRRHHHRPGQRGGDRLGQHLGGQREHDRWRHQRHRDGHHHRRRAGHAGHPDAARATPTPSR